MTEVKVPDIGDFSDVPVIEILVSVGEEVEAVAGRDDAHAPLSSG